MFFKRQPVHFTGIGGIGMSGLAEVLLESGLSGQWIGPEAVADHRTADHTRSGDLRRSRRGETSRARSAVVVSSAVRPRQS